MIVAQIQNLIDKQDNRELVRDQIAAILKAESNQQRVLALAASKDESLWKLRVYSEKNEPWSAFSDTKRSPLVNVWVENSNFDKAGSDPIHHQKSVSTFHVDCYGYGITQDTLTGHAAADRMAVLEAERAVRLCRNILMSSYYTYLGFPQGAFLTGDQKQVVWSRWSSSVTSFQPAQTDHPVERVAAIRLDLEVTYSEYSPQYQGEPLEILALSLTKDSGGEWFSSDFNLVEPVYNFLVTENNDFLVTEQQDFLIT